MSGLAVFGLITVLATVGVAVFCLIAYSLIMRKRHFRCLHCDARFKVQPLRTFFASSKGTDKLLICPSCGASDYMEFCHDGDDGVNVPAPREVEESGAAEASKEEERDG